MKKEKQIEIKLYYKCKNKIIKEFRIDKYNVTFGDILDYFYDDIKDKYNQYQLKSKYLFNKKELENKDKILNLLMNENINIHNIKEIKIEIYLDEIYKIYDKDSPKYNKLIIPIKSFDFLELYIYYPEKGTIDIKEYYKKIYENYSFFKINDKTSFINSNNYLFLSGGEYNNELINDFWIIDNTKYSVTLLSMPSPKLNHSMLNINDEYILIIGGNDTKTYLFNISENNFTFFGDTNNIHLNPTLLIHNKYIYCFSEQNQSIIAEKKIFSLEENPWENINLNFGNSEINNEISQTDNLLIILGNKKYYEFFPEKNSIQKIDLNEEENYEININPLDKNFYKLNKYYSACIPKNFNEEKFLYVLNKRWRKIHKMKFSENRYKIKEQYEYNINKVNKENMLIIKATFENKDEGLQLLKLKTLKTKLNDINNENISSEIIINDISLQNEEFNGYEHKSSKNNISFKLTDNVVFDQYFNIVSDLKENQNINRNNPKNLFPIDLTNLADDVENIFTPIRKDLSPNIIKEISFNEKNNDEDIKFDQINFENQSLENVLDIPQEKHKKKVFNFILPKENIDDQIINREIKIEDFSKKQSFNEGINNNETKNESKEQSKEIKSEENNLANKEENDDLSNKDELKNEEYNRKNNDLFLSVDAFGI